MRTLRLGHLPKATHLTSRLLSMALSDFEVFPLQIMAGGGGVKGGLIAGPWQVSGAHSLCRASTFSLGFILSLGQ